MRWPSRSVGSDRPLRYAHSPADVIDLVDLVALADVLQVVAENW